MELGDYELHVLASAAWDACFTAYSMSSAEGLDVEECQDLFTLEELEGGDIACSLWISVVMFVESAQIRALVAVIGIDMPLIILQKIQAAIILCFL
jgi:hypothetical protein